MKSSIPKLVTLMAFVLATACLRAQQPAADPYAGLAEWQFGQSREPLALIEEQIRQTPTSGYPAIEAKLIEVLKAPATPKDAKRYICRWLSVVGSAQCVPAVAELLADEDLSHLARFALESMPSPAAGTALRNALPKVKGSLLVGIVGSLGVRRDAQAVAPLTGLAGHEDPLVAEAAIAALGQIGTEEAAQALESLPARPALSRTMARARITAARHLTAAAQRPQAAGIYRALMHPPDQPPAIRVAALQGLIDALPQAESVDLILDTIQGEDAAMRDATLSAYISSTDKALQEAVAGKLPTLNSPAQRLLLGVLADEPDVSARLAVLKVLQTSKDAQVRIAALACLVRHGRAEDVPLLVRWAQNDSASVADAARKAIERLHDPRANDTLIHLIESPAAGDRAVVLAALASRRVESALPTLVRLVGGADAALAVEAARALGIIGHAGQLPSLAGVLARTDNAALRSAAADATKAICQRAQDKPQVAKTLLAALNQATTTPARLALLPLLIYPGGTDSLATVRKAMQDANPEIREAAVRTLVSWPDASAAPHLLELAKSATNPTHAILALRDGCLRLATMEELPLAQRLDIYKSVLEVASRPEEKKQVITGLAQLPAVGSLELLRSCLQDPALKDDTVLATIRLARQIGAVYHKQALAALQNVKEQAANEDVRKQVDDAIKAVQNAGQSPEGFIVAWMLSGPYTQAGKNGSDLLDIAFAPEDSNARADWRPVTVPPGGRPGLVELDKLFGGNNRAAYLRTQITANREQDALLEIGSDDGVKVWLNGKVVHANNATRPCSPNQDRASVKLQQGPNTLLMKITQGGGEWATCCRVRSPDGKELSDITIAPNVE